MPEIALAIAPLLLLGAHFLGRDKLRKEEEKIRTAEIGGALSQLDEILKNTKAHKYGSGRKQLTRPTRFAIRIGRTSLS